MEVGTTQPQRFFLPVDTLGVMTPVDSRVYVNGALTEVCKTIDTMAEHKQGDKGNLLDASQMLHEILILCGNRNHQVVFSTTPEVPASILEVK